MKRSDDAGRRTVRFGRSLRLEIFFWVAAAITLALHFIPFGELVLYPFTVLGTWAHELGHGLTAALLGGEFLHMHLYAGGGGTAYHTLQGVGGAAVAAAGLLGPAVAGGTIVVLGSREATARWVMAALALALFASALLVVRNVFGVVAVIALTLAAAGIALRASENVRVIVTQLVGINLCLQNLSDFDYMFTRSFMRDGEERLSDTQRIAEVLVLPYFVWGLLLAALAILILVLAYYAAWEWELRWPWKKRADAAR